MKLVECVPNFSEGRDAAKIEQIAAEIRLTEGVKLLDVDPGRDTNRTVMTFIGTPDGVLEAAYRAIAKAAEVIDMRTHTGAHPRMGATDVCPFIPVADVTMEDCAALARKLGSRVGEQLGIPVYLYEGAATKPDRCNLATVRQGEYEGLTEKLKDPEWRPDFGPAAFNAKSGATVIGAREFLIAFNVNLNTRDVRIAREIAFEIREKGRAKRDASGAIVRDERGETVFMPGKFRFCKAVGWYMENFGRSQISMNLVKCKVTPPHAVFDECVRLAEGHGARVTGSELVGLIPLEAVLEAGRHYLHAQKRTTGVPEEELIHIAVLSMGMSELYPFEPAKKIIEYQFRTEGPLVGMKVGAFADVLSTDAPAPGGGSVAALCGALSGALSSMVASLTHGKKGYEGSFEEMESAGVRAQALKAAFLDDVDRDTEAFNRVMEAMRLPKATEADRSARDAAIEEATRGATLVPLGVLRRALDACELARVVVEKGNRNSVSDGGVAALAARTAAEGAFLNVIINLPGIPEGTFRAETLAEAERLRAEAVRHAEETVRLAETRVRKTV
jgi:glutamate formiminotransferase/formiminotetrahydrofolate cyclodeaminase